MTLSNSGRCGTALFTILAGATLLVPAASAQSLAGRIAGAPQNGTVRFSFESKPGVCGDGENISIVRDGETIMSHGRTYRMKDGRVVSEGECVAGPVEVILTKERGTISDARVSVGGARRSVDAEIGTVSPADAVAFMLSETMLAEASGRAAGKLVFGATLAQAESWPQLLRVGRNQSLPERARKDAIFWLAQEAGDKAAAGLTSVIGNDSDELEIRKQAIFALSQIRGEASVDALINVARTSREPEIRKNAIFWLGQSKDPRVLAFFEEVLRG